MATYSITTSVAEEKALTFKTAEKNVERAAETPPKPPLTNGEYLDNILVRRNLLSFKDMMDAEEQHKVKQAYAAANNSTQNQVKTLLGVP